MKATNKKHTFRMLNKHLFERCLMAMMVVMAGVAAGCALSSCSEEGEFRIHGEINDFGTGNLKIVFFDRGAVQAINASAVDGKFSMSGRLSRPSLLRIYTNAGKVAGRMVVRAGDDIEVELDTTEPANTKMKGSSDTEELARFIVANAQLLTSDDSEQLNRVIDSYVRTNPARNTAGVLLADYYDARGNEQRFAELAEILDPKVRAICGINGIGDLLSPPLSADSVMLANVQLYSRADTMATIRTAEQRITVLAWVDADSRSADSVRALLTAPRSDDIRLIEIGSDPDTATWRQNLREFAKNDTLSTPASRARNKKIERMWAPSVYQIAGLEELQIRAVPWFVVADSTTRVLYSGPSATAARQFSSLR